MQFDNCVAKVSGPRFTTFLHEDILPFGQIGLLAVLRFLSNRRDGAMETLNDLSQKEFLIDNDWKYFSRKGFWRNRCRLDPYLIVCKTGSWGGYLKV